MVVFLLHTSFSWAFINIIVWQKARFQCFTSEKVHWNRFSGQPISIRHDLKYSILPPNGISEEFVTRNKPEGISFEETFLNPSWVTREMCVLKWFSGLEVGAYIKYWFICEVSAVVNPCIRESSFCIGNFSHGLDSTVMVICLINELSLLLFVGVPKKCRRHIFSER